MRAYRERREGASYPLPKSQGALFFSNGPHETEALAGDGADPALLLPIVTDGPSNGVDPCADGRIRDDARAPDPRKKLIPADDVITVPDQEFEEIEHQRLERNQFRSRSQLATLRVENHVAKMERHDAGLQPADIGCSPAVP